MSIIHITCRHCNQIFAMKRLTLSQYWGKSVKIKCKHCRSLNPIIINAELMSGKPHQSLADDNPDGTQVLGTRSVSQYILANIQVVSNDLNHLQDYELKVGNNIIGRGISSVSTHDEHRIGIETKDNKMSRVHCKIIVTKLADGAFEYILSDMGSTNGTYYIQGMDKKRLDEFDKIYLNINDKIGLGLRTEIILKSK